MPEPYEVGHKQRRDSQTEVRDLDIISLMAVSLVEYNE